MEMVWGEKRWRFFWISLCNVCDKQKDGALRHRTQSKSKEFGLGEEDNSLD